MNEQALAQQLKKVYYYLLKLGATREDAEDIVQETAYTFYGTLFSIRSETAENWIFRVAINRYYDLLRKEKYRSHRQLYFDLSELFDLQTPEDHVLTSELKEEIQKTFTKLKPKETELLILKYSFGLSLSEIAGILDTTDKSVKTMLARARANFIKYFEGDV